MMSAASVLAGACADPEFTGALSYALSKLGVPDLAEASYCRVWQEYMFPDTPFCV